APGRGATAAARRPSPAAGVAAVRPAGIAGPGQSLDADHIWVPGVGGQDLVPGVFARHTRLVDADVLHGRSTPRPVAVGNRLTGKPARLLDRFFQDATSWRLAWASH